MDIKKVSDLLKDNQAQLATLLPKIITPSRFMATCINVVQNDEKLHDCTSTSLVRCMFQAAQMALIPGLRRQCYFVPYNNTKKQVKEAQLQIGYQGMLTLARRSGQISIIDAGYVLDGDTFEWSKGFDVVLRHVENSPHRRDGWKDAWVGEGDKKHLSQDKAWECVTHIYSFAKMTNGERHINVMTKEEIEWHRDRYSKAARSGPWVDNIMEMGEKTSIRELCNLLPADEEDNLLGKAVALDRQLEDGQPQTIEVVGFTIPDDDDEKASHPSGNGHGQSSGKPPEPAKPQAMKLPNFGHAHAKDKPVNHPDVTMQDLEYYLDVKEKGLGKPGREQFHDFDVKLIAAIKAEMERRKGLAAQAGASASTQAKPAESTTEETSKRAVDPPKDKPAEPKPTEPTGVAMSEEDWQAFVNRVTVGDDATIWSQTKKEFKAKIASAIPTEDRARFVARFHEIKKASVPA